MPRRRGALGHGVPLPQQLQAIVLSALLAHGAQHVESVEPAREFAQQGALAVAGLALEAHDRRLAGARGSDRAVDQGECVVGPPHALLRPSAAQDCPFRPVGPGRMLLQADAIGPARCRPVEGTHMNPLSIITGFIPQVLVFAILANWLPLGWAAVAGLAVALALIAVTATRGGVKILLVAQAVILAVFTVVGFTAGHHDATAFEPYARGVASLALGAFILATSFSFPFTAQFARRGVPQQYWNSPRFLAVNRRISLVWGLAVLAIGASHLAAVYAGSGTRWSASCSTGASPSSRLPGLLRHQAHDRPQRPPAAA